MFILFFKMFFVNSAFALVTCGPNQACTGSAQKSITIDKVPFVYTVAADACADEASEQTIAQLPSTLNGDTNPITKIPVTINHNYKKCVDVPKWVCNNAPPALGGESCGSQFTPTCPGETVINGTLAGAASPEGTACNSVGSSCQFTSGGACNYRTCTCQ